MECQEPSSSLGSLGWDWLKPRWIQDKSDVLYNKQNKTGHSSKYISYLFLFGIEIELGYLVFAWKAHTVATAQCWSSLCLLIAFCKHPPWIVLSFPSPGDAS